MKTTAGVTASSLRKRRTGRRRRGVGGHERLAGRVRHLAAELEAVARRAEGEDDVDRIGPRGQVLCQRCAAADELHLMAGLHDGDLDRVPSGVLPALARIAALERAPADRLEDVARVEGA